MATEQELKEILGKAQGEALAVLKEVQREVVGKDGAILRILLAMCCWRTSPGWEKPPWPWPSPGHWASLIKECSSTPM